ncbi:hypothetical protein RCO27_18670 [Sphingosinicella sp. LHD-64]|uniref:hypothetical protein n=1 Tax=Sphingosinicella sp. LHD-64 TaxID=3072139 RepID=UPI00280CC238|nr:hypothetical protein [Sphingosinicella sp. LHD-64]MDQ8758257.1 hypothetical protein [Sphingosinicella sp. LHD-64]
MILWLALALQAAPAADGAGNKVVPFPAARARADSTQAPPLRRSDLAWADDPVCGYRRVFTADPASGRYAPDVALPPCDDYLDF